MQSSAKRMPQNPSNQMARRSPSAGPTGVPKHRILPQETTYSNLSSAQAYEKPLVSEIRLRRLYRDAVCDMTEKTVALALDVPLSALRTRTRCADVASARQIAMYLCHTIFSVALTEIGQHFKRDRTTVAHACHVVEDRRDEDVFDLTVNQLEELLNSARFAAGVCQLLEPDLWPVLGPISGLSLEQDH